MKNYSIQTRNSIERRFELFDKLADLKFPPGCSAAEENRIFDERLSAVQEIVEINAYLGEYDDERKTEQMIEKERAKADSVENALIGIIAAINAPDTTDKMEVISGLCQKALREYRKKNK